MIGKMTSSRDPRFAELDAAIKAGRGDEREFSSPETHESWYYAERGLHVLPTSQCPICRIPNCGREHRTYQRTGKYKGQKSNYAKVKQFREKRKLQSISEDA